MTSFVGEGHVITHPLDGFVQHHLAPSLLFDAATPAASPLSIFDREIYQLQLITDNVSTN